ncbi:hypothetical protein [Agarilytica rhodophyticola]|uniref:hypothetical protein n=1 Tax=Agarilytica rhodophyticola TaxID=1737490 RepID=UPI000B34882E|nr:hypothetical protein [Agarilytica rhodophyticola]
MKHVATKFFVLFLFFNFSNSLAYEKNIEDTSYFSEKDSIAFVLKLSGKIGCGYFNSLLHKNHISTTHNCDKKLIQNRLDNLSKDIKYESFLIVNNIRGKFQPGQIIKVPYDRNPGPSTLQTGEEGVIFFKKLTHEGRDIYLYSSCDVFYSEDMVDYFSSQENYSKDTLIDYIINKKLSSCS